MEEHSYSRNIHILVDTGNVLLEMLANDGELATIDSHHSELVYFAQSAQIE